MDAPRVNIPEWTVSELSAALRKTVEDAYGFVRVRGEVSGFRGATSSGHVYFRLKDDRAVLEAVIWKGTWGRLRVRPEEGLDVIATGRLSTFAGSSKYQIVIDAIEPAGIGALMALLEQRKKLLAAEGLFDPARKQLLPHIPDVIGVVTSPTGAVIRDILHRLADRFPRRVLVWPVRVQGEGSAAEIAAAIRGFNALPADGPLPRPDLLIVARGGGSLEDLWSFNEEIVVRAAADSMIPLISAVGHETDVTLIDFAADVRAPTPTAAAEMAVPVRADLVSEVDDLARRLRACWQRGLDGRRTELRRAARSLPGGEALLAVPRQRVDAAADRLPRALRSNAQIHHTAFSRIAGQMTPGLLRRRLVNERRAVEIADQRARRSMAVMLERRRERFASVAARMTVALRTSMQTRRDLILRTRERVKALAARAAVAMRAAAERRGARLDRAAGLLVALSYHGVLARGFALVRGPGGVPLRAAAQVPPGGRLDIEFADGHVSAVATGGPAPEDKLRPRKGRAGGRQGDLF